MNKQKLTLAILLGILLLSLGYSFIRMPQQKTAAKLTHTSGTPASPAAIRNQAPGVKSEEKAVPGNSQLQTALLEQQQAQFKGFRRNIFKPIFREEMKILPLPPPPPAPPQKSIVPVKPVPPAATTPSPADTAKKEMGRLRFLGFLKKDARKTIFLSEGSEIFLVRKGDKIAGRYEVTALTDEAITISVVADKSDLVFPLVESRSLTVGSR